MPPPLLNVLDACPQTKAWRPHSGSEATGSPDVVGTSPAHDQHVMPHDRTRVKGAFGVARDGLRPPLTRPRSR